MALFKRKTKDDKKAEKESAKVDDAKKDPGADNKKQQEKTQDKKQSMKELYSDSGKTVTTTTKDGKKEKKVRRFGQAHKILVKPLVTEKAANLGAVNQYVFEVAPKANKIEIAKAVHEVYGIKPTGVNIIKMPGKQLSYGRYTGKRRDWKKAIITLPTGKSINIYEGV